MTRDEILRVWYSIDTRTIDDHIERFAALVADREREKCAKVVLEAGYKSNGVPAYEHIADAIRARSQSKQEDV